MVCAESLSVRAPDSYGRLSGQNLRDSRNEHILQHLFEPMLIFESTVCLLKNYVILYVLA
jgi:hypothetical protein